MRHDFDSLIEPRRIARSVSSSNRTSPAKGQASAVLAWLVVQAVRLATLPFDPGRRLGFGGNQPRALMRDWLRNATSGRHQLHRSRIVAAIDVLIDKLPRAFVERATVLGVRGHSPWKRRFRGPDGPIPWSA